MQSVDNQFNALESALSNAERRFVAANPLSAARHERACQVLPAGHSRQTLYYAPFPVTITRGEGARVYDLDGHEYVNLVGDYAAGVYGHTAPQIQAAVQQALTGGVFLSGVNTREVELAELISSRIPSMEMLRFCNSGSEACLYAALLARYATHRDVLLVFKGCYHGGFMIYGDEDPPLSAPFQLEKATFNDTDGTRTLLRKRGASIAAVLVEPVMGSAGCIPATVEFLSMLRTETEQLGIVLIFDEVMTSRLGAGGVQGLIRIRPDLTTLGKFWGGGFSFGAFGGTQNLMRHFDTPSGGVLSQAGTFNNNIIAMTAGFAGARDIYTSEACTRLNDMGDRLRTAINSIGQDMCLPLQVTGRGAVMNMHWHRRPISHPGDVEAHNSPARRLFQLEMMEAGYYMSLRGMISLSLPLNDLELSDFVATLTVYLKRNKSILERITIPAG